jgi:hypothetical protein
VAAALARAHIEPAEYLVRRLLSHLQRQLSVARTLLMHADERERDERDYKNRNQGCEQRVHELI